MRILVLYLLTTAVFASTASPQKQHKAKRGVLLGSGGLGGSSFGLDLGNSLESAGISGGYTSALSIGASGGLSNGISGLTGGYGSNIGAGINGGLSTGLAGISGALSTSNVQSVAQQVPVLVHQQYPASKPVSAPYYVRQSTPLINELPFRVSQPVPVSQSVRPGPISPPIPIQQTASQPLMLSGTSMSFGPTSLGSGIHSSGLGTGLGSGFVSGTGLHSGQGLTSGVSTVSSGNGPAFGSGLPVGSGLVHGLNYRSALDLNSGYSSGLNSGLGSVGISDGFSTGYGSGLGWTLGSGLESYGSGLTGNLASGYGSGYGYTSGSLGQGNIIRKY